MVVTRADGYIGSATNLIMVASTGLVLAAGRFGLAPTANRLSSAGARVQTQRGDSFTCGARVNGRALRCWPQTSPWFSRALLSARRCALAS